VNIAHMKLYHWAGTRSARVKWLLHELLGDAFEVENVALESGEQYGAAFSEINPAHCVPVLEITWRSGALQNMVESAAMADFLADAFPQKRLAPPPGASPERADYLQMLHFASTSMDAMLWQLRLHERLLPAAARDERSVARCREKFLNHIEPLLAARLSRAPHSAGTNSPRPTVSWAMACSGRGGTGSAETTCSRPTCLRSPCVRHLHRPSPTPRASSLRMHGRIPRSHRRDS
jgi:glutathione S-transferase